MVDDNEGDALLMRRLADGDRTALADAFDRFAPVLSRYAWGQADGQDDVETVVQDAFLTLWHGAAGITLATSALLPWLLVVCRDHARRVAPGVGDGLQDSADETRGPLRWIGAEILAMAPLDRRITELCLVEGHSYDDAAEALGLRVGPAARKTPRSRARLEKAVTHDEH